MASKQDLESRLDRIVQPLAEGEYARRFSDFAARAQCRINETDACTVVIWGEGSASLDISSTDATIKSIVDFVARTVPAEWSDEVPLFDDRSLGKRVIWTEVDHEAAAEQGWHLDWKQSRIVALDDDGVRPVTFVNDHAALTFVSKKALDFHDERCIRALILHSLHTARALLAKLSTPTKP